MSTCMGQRQVSATRAPVSFAWRPKYWVPAVPLAAAVAETPILEVRFTVNRYLSGGGTYSGVRLLNRLFSPLLPFFLFPSPHASQIGSQSSSRREHLLLLECIRRWSFRAPDPDFFFIHCASFTHFSLNSFFLVKEGKFSLHPSLAPLLRRSLISQDIRVRALSYASTSPPPPPRRLVL